MHRLRRHRCLALLITVASPLQASAESHEVCDAYARDAVEAYRTSQQQHCGWLGPRWNDNRQAHYDWCRAAPAEWVANEARFRANDLRVCRNEPGTEGCREYAIVAVAQQRSNVGGQCGLSGPRWGDSYDHHLAWCLHAPGPVATRETEIRGALLGVCGGSPEHRRCDGYAREAEAQVREAGERGCAFEGPRWTPLYEDHLAWCLTQPAAVAAQESRERAGPLSQCRTQLPQDKTGGEACLWTAYVRVDACANVDGSPSSTPEMSNIGCGASEDAATARAKAGLSVQLSDEDEPEPGTCTYSVDARPGCSCG